MLLSAALFLPAWVQAAPRWYLETLGEGFDKAALGRAVAVEFHEIELPADPERPMDTPLDVQLHVEVQRTPEGLRVRIWDRGELLGSRLVSRRGQGSIVARRLALAAGEIVREAAEKRAARAQDLEAAALQVRAQDELARQRAAAEELAVIGAFDALVLPGAASAFGPSLGLSFNTHIPVRLNLGLSVLGGPLSLMDAGGPPGATWSLYEARAAALYSARALPHFRLEFGPQLGAGAVRSSSAVTVDQTASEHVTWSLRFFGEVRALYEPSPGLGWFLSASGGGLLRPIPLTSGALDEHLQGGFVGLSLGLTAAL